MNKKINLKNAEKELRKVLNVKRGLDFEYKYENDCMTASNSITCKTYKDDIYVSLDVYEDGLLCISLVFDKINLTDQVIDLINKFNKTSVWLTAYVNNKGYLKLRNNIFVGSEKSAVENIDFILDHFLSDKIKNVLSPLSQLTYSAN